MDNGNPESRDVSVTLTINLMFFFRQKFLESCKTLTSTWLMTTTCSINRIPLDSCANAVHGTVAEFQCAPYYEVVGEKDPFRLCSNGSWGGSLPTCVPGM